MAIWSPSEGYAPQFGAERGEVWARGSGSFVLLSAPRSASRLARRQFATWTPSGPWPQRWKQLTAGERTAWTNYAAANRFHGLTGRPAFINAEEFFVRYWAQVKLFQGSNPSAPWTPPSPPAWQAGHQPFLPFLDAAEGMAIVLRAARANPIDFFFAAQPPLEGRQALTRSRLVPLGTFTCPAGDAGQLWTEPADAAADLFGPAGLSASHQQWLLAWEISNGAPAPILDPCYTPPPGPPPGPMCDGCAGLFVATYSDAGTGFPAVTVVSQAAEPPCSWHGEAYDANEWLWPGLTIYGSPGDWYLDQTTQNAGGYYTETFGPNANACPAGQYSLDVGGTVYTWSLS